MARQSKCNRCEGRLGTGPYCPKCGYPAPWASHEDRVEWELRQWMRPAAAAVAGIVEPSEPESSPFAPPHEAARPSLAPSTTASAEAPTGARAEAQPDTALAVQAKKAPASYSPTVIHPKRGAKTSRARKASEAKSPLAPKRKGAAKQGEAKGPAPHDDSTVASMLQARRLPSLADIEAAAAEGPPLIKILRLLALRVAVLEAQVPSDVAKTG